MAVYSKGFAKPEDEEHCKWYDEPFMRPYPYCHFLRKSCLGLDRCPLVYIPEPHGRLIDADALNYTMLYKENWMRGTGVEAPAVWRKDIDDAPTIIPANHGSGPDEA